MIGFMDRETSQYRYGNHNSLERVARVGKATAEAIGVGHIRISH